LPAAALVVTHNLKEEAAALVDYSPELGILLQLVQVLPLPLAQADLVQMGQILSLEL
jgi:hypothetical protein